MQTACKRARIKNPHIKYVHSLYYDSKKVVIKKSKKQINRYCHFPVYSSYYQFINNGIQASFINMRYGCNCHIGMKIEGGYRTIIYNNNQSLKIILKAIKLNKNKSSISQNT